MQMVSFMSHKPIVTRKRVSCCYQHIWIPYNERSYIYIEFVILYILVYSIVKHQRIQSLVYMSFVLYKLQ